MANNSKVALLCAYTLASAGRYEDAEGLLLSDVEVSKTPEAMDLLARIRTEQGDRAEARRLWQEILSVHSGHEPSRRALRVLDKSPYRFSCRTLWWMSIIGTFLVSFILGGWLFAGSSAPEVVAVRWERMATGDDLAALEPYRGKVARVVVASSFFDQAKNIAQRSVLRELLASALGLTEDAVLMGAPAAGTPGETIDLELQLKKD